MSAPTNLADYWQQLLAEDHSTETAVAASMKEAENVKGESRSDSNFAEPEAAGEKVELVPLTSE